MVRLMKKHIMFTEDNRDRDLLLINMQPSMEGRMTFDITEFGEWFDNNGDDFITIYYFYNGSIGDSKNDNDNNITKWYSEKLGIKDGFVAQAQDIKEIVKYYDKILDSNYTDSEIIALAKYMTGNNYDKLENLKPQEFYYIKGISDQFRTDLIDGKFNFNIPHDMLRQLKNMRNPLIIGGIGHETIRYFQILLNVINKKYELSDQWTF